VNKTTITGAQAVLKSLMCEGVTKVFGYPGGAIMPVYDALHDDDLTLEHVLVRHEQGAVHAAEGYARMTGEPGICIATSGPGATNLITGIADAMLDSVPIVCITGQVASHLLGTDAFQEADIIGMTIPVTKWNYQITRAEEIPAIMAKAYYIAKSGRPGPVLIDITKDAQFGMLDFVYEKYKPKMPAYVMPTQEALQQASDLINSAKKPYILVGHGVLIAKAEQALLDFVDKTQIPTACTLLGLSAFPSKHPHYVGMLGMHGNYGANVLTNEADVIIAVGMRFDDRVTGNLAKYAKQAKIIHIDIDPVEINKHMPTTVALISDAAVALQALLPLVEKNTHTLWRQAFQAHDDNEFKTVIEAEIHNDSNQIKMAEVIHQLSKKTEGNAILVTDVGQHQMVAARYYQFNTSNAHITSGGAGTMGFALPAAIGAKIAMQNREVIVIAGDGGFQMNIQELGVIAQENLKVKIIVLNNSFLGMVRQWQELFFNERYSFTKMHNPDFVMIAKAYGIPGQSISERADLDKALEELLNADSAYLLEVMVETQEKVFPMIPTGAGVGEMRLS
jgi:acetolactate synthase I/II/III large subunit